MFELKSTEEFDGTENSWKIWRKTDLCLFGKFFYSLSKSDLISESKMVELYQNNNSKQLDRPDVLRKLYFIFKISKYYS